MKSERYDDRRHQNDDESMVVSTNCDFRTESYWGFISLHQVPRGRRISLLCGLVERSCEEHLGAPKYVVGESPQRCPRAAMMLQKVHWHNEGKWKDEPFLDLLDRLREELEIVFEGCRYEIDRDRDSSGVSCVRSAGDQWIETPDELPALLELEDPIDPDQLKDDLTVLLRSQYLLPEQPAEGFSGGLEWKLPYEEMRHEWLGKTLTALRVAKALLAEDEEFFELAVDVLLNGTQPQAAADLLIDLGELAVVPSQCEETLVEAFEQLDHEESDVLVREVRRVLEAFEL